MRRMILTSSLLLALSASAMAGQVYKWVDAQGGTHFSGQPPQGQQATTINTATPPPKAAETEAAAPFESAADPQQAAIDEKVKREVAIQEAERKKYCQSMRTNLAQLENNPRVRVEVDGEVRRLSEEQRQQRISEAKQAIVKNCT
ncbi:DUF4124 domain-containing protein [Pseudomonas sp.]|uniref:DUF4124 domain-containing protein n=1 Tax=Pseudomonas sp. TaxID=306 RepID=UPI0027316FAD|nr:DUF4124 domain-containing protein [Pseudomonas sp.]MDP2245393.1 DUF4124 domain-containing protein [Pseudomonas sp.]